MKKNARRGPLLVVTVALAAMVVLSQATAQSTTMVLQYPENSTDQLAAGKILVQAYAKIGITVSLVPVPSERALQNANNGSCDGIVCNAADLAIFAKNYPNLVMVDKPIYSINAAVFVKDKVFEVKGWDCLKPYTIGYPLGNKWVQVNTQGMKTFQGENAKSLFQMLDAGRLDVVVVPRASGEKVIKDYGFASIKALSPDIAVIPMYHFVNKKHADKIPALLKVLP
ncbi:MAG: hypothetical protein KBB32_03895 [Spirochaetia bacterium]|nr:hypothetical protein [Spirochaetia bacterium]